MKKRGMGKQKDFQLRCHMQEKKLKGARKRLKDAVGMKCRVQGEGNFQGKDDGQEARTKKIPVAKRVGKHGGSCGINGRGATKRKPKNFNTNRTRRIQGFRIDLGGKKKHGTPSPGTSKNNKAETEATGGAESETLPDTGNRGKKPRRKIREKKLKEVLWKQLDLRRRGWQAVKKRTEFEGGGKQKNLEEKKTR